MDKALKQRLVGASVLIILAVIVLPMLLSGRSDTLRQESPQIELPPKPEELSMETRRFPVAISNKTLKANRQEQVGTTVADEPDTQPVVAPDQAIADSEVAGAVGGADPADAANPEPLAETDADAGGEGTDGEAETLVDLAATPTDVTTVTLRSERPENLDISEQTLPSQDSPRYLVQVASYSSEKNANLLAEQLRMNQFPVLMDVVDRVTGPLYRVRVGPYAERSEADVVVSSLSSKMGELSPRVLDLRPDDSSPVTTPSDPLVRWVVQVGSFSSSERAEALVAQLRLGGLAAYSESVTSAGKTVYKVHVGPELDRKQAIDLAGRIKAEHGLEGFVTTEE